jgi:hypothetical protein
MLFIESFIDKYCGIGNIKLFIYLKYSIIKSFDDIAIIIK